MSAGRPVLTAVSVVIITIGRLLSVKVWACSDNMNNKKSKKIARVLFIVGLISRQR
jgi:uncharacterized membrane protein